MDMARESEDRAWARVEKMMIISSMPYMRFRPMRSASHPKNSWPMTVPPEVDTLIAVSALEGILPAPLLASCQ